MVQSEPTEPIEIEDDKFATIKPNDRSSVSITEQVEYSSDTGECSQIPCENWNFDLSTNVIFIVPLHSVPWHWSQSSGSSTGQTITN